MKQVFIARHPAEAHIVRGILESRGISAEVRGEDLWGARGELPVTFDTLPSVWIHDDEREGEAAEILKEFGKPDRDESGVRDDWVCPNCHESLEGQFTDCWKCGTSRPGQVYTT
ncbi:MAG TPA: DUF2007 domain-containing protein [Thermoanaerobaculia bacterium]|nr:DUF2007 domain-containing protein [Thermoanaerobaculia bacterium]HUM29924.1 DUF2007 domain-containing protein [Thermoanaerobaculia bacterium]HXK68209.1 DUF2007 domain-containing protein [Thermoanaerobaculia bacterium]